MLKYFDQNQMGLQLMSLHPQAEFQGSNDDPAGLLKLIEKLQADEAQLLEIAFHLSQAITRLGCTSVGIDSRYEHNEVIAIAQRSQADLQEWIARSMGEVRNARADKYKG